MSKLDGYAGPEYANRLRPKADFGGDEASPGSRCQAAEAF
jgi:hypothetical protein